MPLLIVLNRFRPSVSGERLAVLIAACLGVSAILIPTAAHLPRWIEFELVLVVWWLVWWVALSWMLFRGHRVEHDARLPEANLVRRIPWAGAGEGTFWGIQLVFTEGCLVALLVPIIAFVLVAATLFAYELLVPGIAFLIYFAIRGMAARVTNDHDRCHGMPSLAMFWGMTWATAYTLPIAAIVYGVHWWILRGG